jgi:hypothetical protein
MGELLSRDDAHLSARLAAGMAGTSHPSQLSEIAGLNTYWAFRSPHERLADGVERRPLAGARAQVVQAGCNALAAALHVEAFAAMAYVATRLHATKPGVRRWALDGTGARLFIGALADLVESIEKEMGDGKMGNS